MSERAKNRLKRTLSLVLLLAMALALAACQMGPTIPEVTTERKTNTLAMVYYLNPDAAHDAQWQELAALYTQKTGFHVKVVTPENYRETLAAEMPQIEAPTLFAVSGEAELGPWSGAVWNLSGTKACEELSLPALAMEKDDAVLALPYDLSVYGLMVNGGLLEQAGHYAGEINSFEKLQAVAEDITQRQEELGFAAFASLSLDDADEPGPAAMLANVALWRERAQETGESHTLARFKAAWDLYTTNSTCEPSMLANRAAGEGMNEFTSGKAAFYLAGSWQCEAVKAAMPEADLAVLPVYIGAENEGSQGLSIGGSGYWCVNGEADLDDIQATLDFVYWCVSTEEGIAALEAMGYALPYRAAPVSSNFLISHGLNMAAEGRGLAPWTLAGVRPDWESELNAALAAYVSGSKWDDAAFNFTDAILG